MEKLGVSPDNLLGGLRNEKNILAARKRALLQEEGGLAKHAKDLRCIDDELADIESEIVKLQKTQR